MTNPKNVSESGDAGKAGKTGDITVLAYINLTVYLAAVGIEDGVIR